MLIEIEDQHQIQISEKETSNNKELNPQQLLITPITRITNTKVCRRGGTGNASGTTTSSREIAKTKSGGEK